MNDKNTSTIRLAAVKGRTVWLQNLLMELLPQLDQPSTDYQTWLRMLISVMEHRGLTQPSQQKDYLCDVRNAIRVIDPNHPALEVVDFDTSTWIALNNRASDRLGERKTKFLNDPDAIVKRATTLLGSYQWSEIACGLAVVTGRRCTEVIKTAQFEYKTNCSVTFTGALKRGNEPVECVFEIPTLCEAQLVIKAIANLRFQLGEEIQNLSKRQVASRYGRAVAKKCDRYFDEFVPPREDKDNLYTHLFRAVYATIASYWYCPPTIPEIEFRAAIQGHYQIIDEQDPKLRRSIAASRNYFDYRIADGHGNIDGRLGIKLGLPDVEVIQEFRTAYIPPLPQSQSERIPQPSTQSNKPKIMNQSSTHRASDNSAHTNVTTIPPFFQSRLSTIADKLGISPIETIQALFTWTEMGLSLAEQLQVKELTPQAIFESVEQLKAKASHNVSLNPLDSSDSVSLDSHSINQLSTSIRFLSEALSLKHNSQINKPLTQESVSPTIQHQAPSLTTEGKERVDSDNSKSNHEISSSQVSQNHYSAANEPVEPVKPVELTTTYPPSSSESKSKSFKFEGSSRKLSKRTIEADEEVNQAIDAIIKFNNQENLTHNDKWRICASALRKLTQRGDSVTKRVLESRANQIQQHHAQHKIPMRHNSKGKNHPSIDEVIAL